MTAKKLPTLDEYYDMLTKHDFYHMFSNNAQVYSYHHSKELDLKAIANTSEPHMELLRQFTDHFFSGEAFGTEQAPLPKKGAQ